MKCFVPEISWHNRDPVYSLDIQPKVDSGSSFYRLASGGADSHVVIWHVTLRPENKANQFASFECAADLQRHQKSVNAVRFSPSGTNLASGDDDGIIIIWRMRLDQDPPELGDEHAEKDKETWITMKVLRGHLQDIYDLSWSPDSTQLISGSIDNTAIMWDAEKGKNTGIIGDHKGFVQGVSWDPKGKYVATLSTDRTLRVFDASRRKLVGRCFKSKLPWSAAKVLEKDTDKGKENKDDNKGKEGKDEKEKLNKMFHNDTLKTFFRRLSFSPNGELLIAPCGVIEEDGVSTDATYVFTRGVFNKPAIHLPSHGQYTVAVKCCPVLFQLRGSKPGLFALPYRIVYAVATRSTVVLYDTEQKEPFGFVSNIHYTGLTDITWSPDGRLVVISSSEGYCSVITFDENEIGLPYSKENQQSKESEKTKLKSPTIDKENKEIICEPSNSTNQVKESESSLEKFDMETDAPKSDSSAAEPMLVDLVFSSDVEMTPVKEGVLKNETSGKITPEKVPITDSVTPKKSDDFKVPDASMMTPMKMTDMELNCSQCSELSLVVEGDESELISKEEQARRLMSPYQGSPKQESPKHTKPEDGSPKTPKSGRRVSLITLSSPKTKRKL